MTDPVGDGLTPAQRAARAQAEADLALPQTRAFLDTVSTEGTQRHGYYTMYGGGRADDLSTFPGGGRHSPSGRYQMTAGTFARAQKALGLTDFSPNSQDLAAAWLLHANAILPYLKIGDFNGALDPASTQWSSLPMNESGDANPANGGQSPKDYTAVFNTYRNNLKRYQGQ